MADNLDTCRNVATALQSLGYGATASLDNHDRPRITVTHDTFAGPLNIATMFDGYQNLGRVKFRASAIDPAKSQYPTLIGECSNAKDASPLTMAKAIKRRILDVAAEPLQREHEAQQAARLAQEATVTHKARLAAIGALDTSPYSRGDDRAPIRCYRGEPHTSASGYVSSTGTIYIDRLSLPGCDESWRILESIAKLAKSE